ncbi:hypothetical protein O181_021828 [Austropuccinia psidii MF-1]|uniref:Uncharacterized protein n=1 Tax=Austropuccinia psidii MF-1 TaxID=1389203 RepID=A0A9Q3CFM5_9BASI|nr:hypothetical protein [Austropuccinia psidii MF-1]
MLPVHLRNQPGDREGLSRTRRSGRGHSGGSEDIEGNHTHSSIHFLIQQKPQTRGLEGYGSSSSAPPTPQRPFSMEHGQQEIQPSIQLGINWRKLPEDIIQRSYGNHQRMESHQEERAARISKNQATIQAIEEPLNQTGPTQIPSDSQGVDHTSSSVASNLSGTNRSVTKIRHFSQSQVVSRRRQGFKGKNKTSFNQSQRESDPMIQKLLGLVKEVKNSQK